MDDFDRTVDLIDDLLGAHRPSGGYVAAQVGRSFVDLARFRASLRDEVFRVEGVASLGVKETANRVEVGITAPAAEAAVRALVHTLGIPDEAVAIVNVPTPQAASHTLHNQHPTGSIEGGWEIGPSGCTLGFGAIRSDGSQVFVVNSHCTTTSPGFDGGPVQQPDGGSFVGSEILDPAGWSCGVLRCRHSDAALISAAQPLQFGKIARTTERTGADISGAALTIDHANPSFTISASYPDVFENEPLDKVGRRTGWSYGAVEDTCTDYGFDGWVRQCSDRVDFAVQDGDSGSPVFYWKTDGTAELRGVVFGWQGWPYNDGLISDLRQIERDLGSLSVHTVRGVIVGSHLVPAFTSQTWTANVTGGKAPFTYGWYRDGTLVSTSTSYTGNTGNSDFQLQLNVADALGGSSSDVLDVTINYCPPPQITC